MGAAKALSAPALLGAALLATTLLAAPEATAEYEKYAMNGTFSVVSNGEWARMNDRYQDEPSVRSTWDVTTTCSSAITCSGKVTSSLGWTEDVYTMAGNLWFVKHYVPDWIPCPDGTRAPGLQVYKFYPANEDGQSERISDLWVGEDITTGESGNCGRNKSLVLNLPVKISKIP
ncbi:Rv2253/PknI dimerization domain-containing protein [Mycolicibacterium grossiae]|uniref:Secreted protein n=1 Tax=Mycolicibacterium grossiae TaxID=1552759 RepID=A0A1E8PZP0_9MYCO|nr:hypothetical protein [Mycolicibacterium grossiae]OFJ51290.1 hypothetical protein BEL07_23475 [Mycolicibacterium grossiae]QEM47445.1 hypothetical protein FZ046_24125 [Mycolicibacterium grossiae]